MKWVRCKVCTLVQKKTEQIRSQPNTLNVRNNNKQQQQLCSILLCIVLSFVHKTDFVQQTQFYNTLLYREPAHLLTTVFHNV